AIHLLLVILLPSVDVLVLLLGLPHALIMKKIAPSGATSFRSILGTPLTLHKEVGKLPMVLSLSLVFYLLTILSCSITVMNPDNLVPKLTFATINCNSLNMS
ncbi:MAG: hypothetical protein ACK56I_20685, partial [bacterium]